MTTDESLPQGWAWATLPDLVAAGGFVADGDWVESKDQDPDGEVRLTQLADVGDGYFLDRSHRFLTLSRASALRCTFLAEGDLLIARMPDPLGRACVFPGSHQRCVTAVDVCIVRSAQSGVLNRWLMHFVNSPLFRSRVASLQSGSTRQRISKKNLCTIEVPVPPRHEQDHIAAEVDSYLSRLDDAVAGLARIQRNLKRYRASVLQAAVEGRLVPTEAELARAEGRDYEPASELLKRILADRRRRWEEAELERLKASGKAPTDDRRRQKYREPVAPDVARLPVLPEGWCWSTVDQLTEGARNCSYGVLVPGPDVEGGVPLVRVGDVGDGIVHLSELKRISRRIADKFRKTYLQGGEVLISLVGTIGRTAVVPAALRGANVARAIGVIPVSSIVEPGWIEAWFRSPDQRRQMVEKAHEVARKTLNLEDVRAATVALAPLAEQRRCIELLQDMESIAAAVTESGGSALKRVQLLRQAILRWAFEGNLVDQDPNDEPGAALLERIRKMREAETDRGQTRRRKRGRARA